jgi:shikimate kinase
MIPTKIALIGMPSAGKTSFSKILASKLGYKIIDLDHMVEEKEGTSIANILEEKGAEYFLGVEYSFLQELSPDEKVVISTAGSMIYHDQSMEWLKKNSTICFVDTEFLVIEQRLSVAPKAIVGLKEKGLAKLWEERIPVYKKWADIIVETKDKDSSQVVDEIISKLK